MSVVGIDIGNAFCVVAAAVKGGVDVILNEESKRETPTCVALGERQRFLGAAAASPPPGSTAVSQIKRLIGRPYDLALQSELSTLFPNLNVTADAQGYPLIHFNYRNGEVTLSPTQLLGMLLGSLMRSAERHLSASVSDCCIAVPAHFNDVQRRAVLHAAEIAGLRVRRLVHESSAAALEYGIYRGDFPDKPQARPHVAAFVDVGHSSTQVAIAGFWAEEVRILARAADPNLGGRDFDEVLFNYFKNKLVAGDPNLDVSRSPRARIRLRAACEKVKKVLSANPEAPLHIECFMEDKDASELITRDEFNKNCQPLLRRLGSLLVNALDMVKTRWNSRHVDAVELIGSGSRVPAVVEVVQRVFGQDPRRTLNASECVARGCALQAAMLSPSFKVKPFQIREFAPFPIDISLKDSILMQVPSQVFTKEDLIPAQKVGIFTTRVNALSFALVYSDCTNNQDTATLITYKVGPFDTTNNQISKLKVAFKLNDNGIVSVASVTKLPEKGVAKTIEKPIDERSSMETDESLPHGLQSGMRPVRDEKMHDAYSTRPASSGYQCSNNHSKMNEKTSMEDDCSRSRSPLEDAECESGMEIDESLSSGNLQCDVATHKLSLTHNASSIDDSDRLPDGDKKASTVKDETERSESPEEPTEDKSMIVTDKKLLSQSQIVGDGEVTAKISNASARIQDSEHPCNKEAGMKKNPINKDAKMKSNSLASHIARDEWEEEEVQVPFTEHVHGTFSREDLETAKRWELKMTEWDRQVEVIKDRKNALESYVYEMRNKLHGKYKEYVLDKDRQSFLQTLKEVEDWLYDQGEDVGCDTYDSYLNALKRFGDPIEARFRESSERESVLQVLASFVSEMGALVTGSTTEHAHVDKGEMEQFQSLHKEGESLLYEVMEVNGRPKYEDPPATAEQFRVKFENLKWFERQIALENLLSIIRDVGDLANGIIPACIDKRAKKKISLEHEKAVCLFNGARLQDSTVTAAEIRHETEHLRRFCAAIPRPPPPEQNNSSSGFAQLFRLPFVRWMKLAPQHVYCNNCQVRLQDGIQQQKPRQECEEEPAKAPDGGPRQKWQSGDSSEPRRPGSSCDRQQHDTGSFVPHGDGGPLEAENKEAQRPDISQESARPHRSQRNVETFEARDGELQQGNTPARGRNRDPQSGTHSMLGELPGQPHAQGHLHQQPRNRPGPDQLGQMNSAGHALVQLNDPRLMQGSYGVFHSHQAATPHVYHQPHPGNPTQYPDQPSGSNPTQYPDQPHEYHQPHSGNPQLGYFTQQMNRAPSADCNRTHPRSSSASVPPGYHRNRPGFPLQDKKKGVASTDKKKSR